MESPCPKTSSLFAFLPNFRVFSPLSKTIFALALALSWALFSWPSVPFLPKIKEARAEVSNVLPNGQTGDTTGDSLSDVTSDDATCDPDTLSAVTGGDTCYTVDKGAVMLLSSFDTSGIPGGSTISGVVLHLQFGLEDGYSGTNPVRYDNGGGLTTTGITPTEPMTGWSADQTFNLFTAGVDTIAEIGAVDIEFTSNDGGGPSAAHFDYVWITVTYTPPVNTTLGSGTDPASATVAPESGIREVGAFTFQTGSGTDTITQLNVSLAASGTPYDGLAQAEIRQTSCAGTLFYTTITTFSSNSLTFSGGTSITATTTETEYKICLTPKTHGNMPAPAGAEYNLSPWVSDWAGTNPHAGSDSNANTLTIDNLSPNGATSTSGSSSDQQVTLNWTTSSSADFDTTSGSVILRWASGSAGGEVPAEGNSSYVAGNTIGTATVACVISSSGSTALSKVDGSGGSAGCTTTALTNGQQYTYKVFQRDTRGNYDVGVLIGTFTPSAAKFWLELPGQTFVDGTGVTGTATVTANQSFSVTIYKTDGANNLDTSYTGSHTINWTWTATSSPNDNVAPTKPTDGAQTFSSGSVTVSGFTLTNASETPTITATEPSGPAGTSSAITVNPGSTTKLIITTNPVSTTAGVETTQYIVERRDGVGNPTTSGTQQVDLSSTSTGGAKEFRDVSAGGAVTFVTIANGVSTENFFYYDEKSGSWTISVSYTGLTGDNKALTVDPATASTFTVTTQNGGTEVAGTAFSVTLTAKDAFGNTVSSGPNNYTGSKTINWTWTATSSPNSTAPTKPADGLQTFSNGVVTVAGFTLTNAGETPTITATDPNAPNPAGTSAAITVQPATAATFTVTTQNGGTETADVVFSVTLTAKDSYGNTVSFGANNYTGAHTINWTWTATSSPNDNVAPSKPSDGTRTFTNGVLTLGGFKLTNASETPTITGTEPSGPVGTSAAITVNPGSTAKLVITTNPTSVTAGQETSQYIVERRDSVGNPTTSGPQQVNLGSNSAGGAKQFRGTSGGGSVTSVTIANGVSTKNFFSYDEKAGGWTISVSASGLTGDSKSLTVNPDVTNKLVIATVPASVEVGTQSGAFVVQRQDQFGNPTTSGTQAVNLGSNSTGTFEFRDSSGGGAVVSVTIGAGVSTEDFFYLDDTAGSWTISVSFTGLTGDSKSFTVIELSAPSGFGGTALSTTSIRWSWTDTSAVEDGFRLYDGGGTLIVEISTANTKSYDETGLSPDTSYTRYVRAYKGASESAASNSATAKTKAPPSPAPQPPAEEAPPPEEEAAPPPAEEEVAAPPIEEEKPLPEEVVEEEIEAPAFWEQVATAVSSVVSSIRGFSEEISRGVVSFVSGILSSAGEVVDNMGRSLARIGRETATGVRVYSRTLSGVWSLMVSGAKQAFSGVGGWVSSNISDGRRTVDEAVREITNGIDRLLLGLDKFREVVFVREPIRIFDVRVEVVSPTEVVVTWKTNHLATSQVNYGSALGVYEYTAYSGEQTRGHRLVLTELTPETTYFYEILSKNRDFAVDAFRSFTTPGK